MTKENMQLLDLFSTLIRNPKFMFALKAEMFAKTQRNRKGARSGSRGLLVELWKEDGLTNAQIAELLDIKPSSVTAQVKELERMGLIERVADEKDKRVSRVFLTQKGKDMKDTQRGSRTEIADMLFGSLTTEEIETLSTLLQKIIDDNQFNPEDFINDERFGNMVGMHDRHRMQAAMMQELRNQKQEKTRMARQMRAMMNQQGRNVRFGGGKPEEMEDMNNFTEDDWNDF